MNEALRWYKEKEGLTIAPPKYAATDGIIQPIVMKKFITIRVEEARDLESKASKSVIPFFYYQFYTFDEHYSPTIAGKNPIFQDEKGFEIEFDDKFKSYADTQRLEIFLFDDAAPMEGDADQQEPVDDMIGTAIVDLKPLSDDKHIHELFVVRDNDGRDVGSIEVKIVAQDITPSGQLRGEARRQVTYNEEWEVAFIDKVCKEVADRSDNCNVGYIYSVFCHGSKTIHVDDFTSQVKMLWVPVTDQEIKLFCENSWAFGGRNYMNREDFETFF